MSRVKQRRLLVSFVALAAVGVLVTGCHPASEGTTRVDDYTAQMSSDDTLILYTTGKGGRTWTITYDGKQTVHFGSNGLFPVNADYTLCGVDCSVKVEPVWLSTLTLTERSDHVVDIQWPWGWQYSSPEATQE